MCSTNRFKRWARLLVVIVMASSMGYWACAVEPVAAAGPDAPIVQPPPPNGSGGEGVGAITGAMISLAQTVMTILMVGASILLCIGIATGAVQGLFATTVGSPYALASSWFKIISIVILAVIAFTAPIISKAVIGTVAGFASGGGIPIFGG